MCLTFLCGWLRSLVCLLAYNMHDWTLWRCWCIRPCLSLPVSVRFCVCVCFVCQLICTSACLYISPSVCVSLHMSVVRVSDRLCSYLRVVFLCASMYLVFDCLYVCLYLQWSLFVCLHTVVCLCLSNRCIWPTFIICRWKAPLAMYHRRSHFAEA